MGNITSGEGNNYLDNGQQTPLNKFIEKVMNEEYFFSPNVNENMINNVDRNDINNQKVLLKRALCTGTSFVPISLPHVTCNGGNCDSGTYTIKINARGEDGTPLPDIEDITGVAYKEAIEDAIRFLNLSEDEKRVFGEDIQRKINDGTITQRELNGVALVGYTQIENSLTDEVRGETVKYGTTVGDEVGKDARIGSTGCKFFYSGLNSVLNYENSNNDNDYNSRDELTGLSKSRAFCGKVLQYNDIARALNENVNSRDSFDNGRVEDIGQFTIRRNRSGNDYKTDEFPDCACLNSQLAVERAQINNIQQQALRLARERGVELDVDAGPELTAESLAQNNDNYCKNRLHDFGSTTFAPSAFASYDAKVERPLTICSSVSLIQGVDQTGGDFEAGTNCGFTPDDNTRISTCLQDPSAPECESFNTSDDNNTSVSKKDDSEGNTRNIIIIVVAVIIVIFAAIFLLRKPKK